MTKQTPKDMVKLDESVKNGIKDLVVTQETYANIYKRVEKIKANTSDENFIKEADSIIQDTKAMEKEFKKHIAVEVIESNGETDGYNLPINSVASDVIKEANHSINNLEVIAELRENVEDIVYNKREKLKMTDEEQEEFDNYPKQDIEDTIDYVVNTIPKLMIDEMGKVLGKEYQLRARDIEPILNNFIVRAFSAKKDQKYRTPNDEKVIPYLKKMWDDNLPLGQNQKSWLYHVEEKTGVKYETIRKIEKKYRRK